jgi:hypothetical protein
VKCYSCDKPLKDGQRIEVVLQGELVDGKFRQTQDDQIRHLYCDGDPK